MSDINTSLAYNSSRKIILVICSLVFSIVLFVFASGRAEAVSNNDRFVTPSVAAITSNFNMCGDPPPSDGQRHAQYPWISPANNTEIDGQATAPQGANSVNLRFNSVAAHCNKNISSDGSITLQDIISTGSYFQTNGSQPILRAQILSPTGTGAAVSVSGITTSSPNVLDYSCSHTHSLRYVKRCNNSSDPNQPVVGNNFTLTGLNSFPPGEDTINVRIYINVRQVNQFNNGRYYCVLGRTASGGLIQTNVFGLSPRCQNREVRLDVTISRAVIDDDFQLTPTVECNVRTGRINYAIEKNGDQAADDINVTLRYTRNGSTTTVFNGPIDIPNSGWSREETITGLNMGDSLSAQIIVDPVSSSGGSSSPSAECGELTTKPYFRVYGGDVITGRAFDGGGDGQCDPLKNDTAHVRAYSVQQPGGAWVGAGGQFAVSAAGYIQGFMSSNLRNELTSPVAPSPTTGLAFSNYETIPPPGTPLVTTAPSSAGYDTTAYGGCITDLRVLTSSLGPSGEAGLNIVGGGPTIIDDNVDQSEMTWRSAPGDSLNITHDIIHRESASQDNPVWNSIEEVRTPIIMVEGNINIAPGVTRLDGIYFAKGIVDTCATSDMSLCDRKLTINGALIAGEVKFRRTNGDVNSVRPGAENQQPNASSIAEVINFTPNIYLTLSQLTRSTDATSNSSYDSIVGLPPVL